MNTAKLQRRMLLAYKFVFTCGKLTAGFQKISGIGSKLDVEYILEGGRIGAAYPLASASKTSGKLTLEKGWGSFAPFYNKSGFEVGKWLTDPCTIIVYDEKGDMRRIFGFEYGVVTSWECSALNADRSEFVIDTLAIEHNGIQEIMPNRVEGSNVNDAFKEKFKS